MGLKRAEQMCRSWSKAALDAGADWFQENSAALQRARAAVANFRFCFDGGMRGDGRSAAGMVAFAYYPDGQRQFLYAGGKNLGRLDSSLTAELLALEWSLNHFLQTGLDT